MKVIFLKNTKNGKIGDVKNVADGFAMNQLIPNGVVKRATDFEIKRLKENKERNKQKDEKMKDKTIQDLNKIAGKGINIKVNTNEKGHLYKSLNKKDILEAIKKEFKINFYEDIFTEDVSFKEVGEYKLKLDAFGEKIEIGLILESE